MAKLPTRLIGWIFLMVLGLQLVGTFGSAVGAVNLQPAHKTLIENSIEFIHTDHNQYPERYRVSPTFLYQSINQTAYPTGMKYNISGQITLTFRMVYDANRLNENAGFLSYADGYVELSAIDTSDVTINTGYSVTRSTTISTASGGYMESNKTSTEYYQTNMVAFITTELHKTSQIAFELALGKVKATDLGHSLDRITIAGNEFVKIVHQIQLAYDFYAILFDRSQTTAANNTSGSTPTQIDGYFLPIFVGMMLVGVFYLQQRIKLVKNHV